MTGVIGLLPVSGTDPCTASRADPFLSIHSRTSPFPSPQPASFPPARAHPIPFCSRPLPVLSYSVSGPQAYCPRSEAFASPVRGLSISGPHFSLGPGTVFGLCGVLASQVPALFADRGHFSH